MSRVAFILDEFELLSPGQQLLDRFLIGTEEHGNLSSSDSRISVFVPGDEKPLLRARARDFALEIAESAAAAIRGADAVVISRGRKSGSATEFFSSDRLRSSLNLLHSGACCFTDAAVAHAGNNLAQLTQLAKEKNLRLAIGHPVEFAMLLPVQPVFSKENTERALIVVQGSLPDAELEALYAIDAQVELSRCKGGEVVCRKLEGDALWQKVYSGEWTSLLAAAISRSNTIKGDPEKDGRPQDIVGLHLLERLATNARGWEMRGGRGAPLFILVADGALADYNYAVQSGGKVYSAQLYRPPAPQQAHYDAQARWIKSFISGQQRADLARPQFAAEILQKMI